MAIGKRIKFFRNRKGMTQKELGKLLGFIGNTADVRMAQYESEARIPKPELIENMSYYLDINPAALKVPDIDSDLSLMHTLFALEDMYGLEIDQIDREFILRFKKDTPNNQTPLFHMLCAWYTEALLCRIGDCTKEEYDEWRYKYPYIDYQHPILEFIPEKNAAYVHYEKPREEPKKSFIKIKK